MKNDLNKALRPVKSGFSLMFKGLGKLTPYAVKLIFLPIHGINFAIQKARRNPNPYNGAKITRVSNFLGNQLARIPNSIADGIKKI